LVLYERPALGFAVDQAFVFVEGQFDFYALEALPITDQDFAAEVCRFSTIIVVDAQVVVKIYASADQFAAAIALDLRPIGVGIRWGCKYFCDLL